MIQYLKVWGGGIYELDEFYEIADELGILIWQVNCRNMIQGSRSWQPFGEGKNGHKSFRQARICYFRDKCIVYVCNCKFANSTQYNITALTAVICNIYHVVVHFLPKMIKGGPFLCNGWTKHLIGRVTIVFFCLGVTIVNARDMIPVLIASARNDQRAAFDIIGERSS